MTLSEFQGLLNAQMDVIDAQKNATESRWALYEQTLSLARKDLLCQALADLRQDFLDAAQIVADAMADLECNLALAATARGKSCTECNKAKSAKKARR